VAGHCATYFEYKQPASHQIDEPRISFSLDLEDRRDADSYEESIVLISNRFTLEPGTAWGEEINSKLANYFLMEYVGDISSNASLPPTHNVKGISVARG
jgi:hypothetical protein